MKDKARSDHNKRVLAKLKAGHDLSTSTVHDTWYPDRSKGFIKKDPEAVKFLYDEDPIDEKGLKSINGGKNNTEV